MPHERVRNVLRLCDCHDAPSRSRFLRLRNEQKQSQPACRSIRSKQYHHEPQSSSHWRGVRNDSAHHFDLHRERQGLQWARVGMLPMQSRIPSQSRFKHASQQSSTSGEDLSLSEKRLSKRVFDPQWDNAACRESDMRSVSVPGCAGCYERALEQPSSPDFLIYLERVIL